MGIRKSIYYALATIGALLLSAGPVPAAEKHGGSGHAAHHEAKPKPHHEAKPKAVPKPKAAAVHKDRAAGKKKAAHDAGKKGRVHPDTKVTGAHPDAHKPAAALRHGHAASLLAKPTAHGHHATPDHLSHVKPGTLIGLHHPADHPKPTDAAHLDRLAQNVRTQFVPFHRNAFTPNWWRNRYFTNMNNFRWYPHWWDHHNPYYWWRRSNWTSFSQWIPGVAWSAPVVYDYGSQIYYGNDGVYVNGTREYSVDQYYQIVRDLAVTRPSGLSEKSEWMPLGVFALQGPKAASPNAILQLAVSKEGAIAGTSYDVESNITLPIHGAVDTQTQRVAWVTGPDDKSKTVVETWAGNLTKDQSEVLVHVGARKPYQWAMIRMEAPEEGGTASGKPTNAHTRLAGSW